MEKSHVSMEQHICAVCGNTYDTGAILLDKRLRASMERNTVTGMGLCPEHQEKFNEGYIALVGIDPSKTANMGERLKPEDAYRTGSVAHLKFEDWDNVFNASAPLDSKGHILPLVFVDQAVIDELTKEIV